MERTFSTTPKYTRHLQRAQDCAVDVADRLSDLAQRRQDRELAGIAARAVHTVSAIHEAAEAIAA
jgi:hypothetical protein